MTTTIIINKKASDTMDYISKADYRTELNSMYDGRAECAEVDHQAFEAYTCEIVRLEAILMAWGK